MRCCAVSAALAAAAAAPAAADGMADGWYTTSRTEILEDEKTVVTGTIPAWLKGDYLKNSASVYEEPARNLTHTFDGFGKMLRWRFAGGGAAPALRARMLQSNWWRKSEAKGDVVPSALFDHPSPAFSAEQRMDGLMTNCSDNFNVNFHDFGDAVGVLALTDSTPRGMIVDRDDLSAAEFQWGDKWTNKMFDRMSPAHPQTIPDGTHDTVSVVERISATAVAGLGDHQIIVYRVSATTGARTVLHKIKTKRLPYMHSIGATASHAILCAGPLRWEIPDLMAGSPATEAFRWEEGQRSTIYLVPLDPAGAVRTYDTDPFFAFHHINAWEEASGDVVFDVVKNDNITKASPSPVAAFNLGIQRDRDARNKGAPLTELRRYTLPAASGAAATWRAVDLLDADGKRSYGELPSMNPAFRGKQHCFSYFWAPNCQGQTWSEVGLVRKDMCHDDAPVRVWFRANHYPGEPVFVAAPAGAEGDGVLLSAVHDGDLAATYLLVLNATTMEPVAEARRGAGEQHLMGFGIHGQFYPAK